MSVREWITRIISERDKVPASVIEKVISHSYDGASTALNNNNTIEISGFGKFIFNEKRAQGTLDYLIGKKEKEEVALSQEGLSEEEIITHNKRLAEMVKNINLLKTKL